MHKHSALYVLALLLSLGFAFKGNGALSLGCLMACWYLDPHV